MQRKLVLMADAGAVLAGLLWLWVLCTRQPQVPFLPRHSPAGWVVYPKPTVPYLQAVAELPTTFRRSFMLSHVPATAALSLRACRRCLVSLNGSLVPGPAPGVNWKEPLRFELAGYMRPGANTLSVTVFNDLGPPALWLSLRGEGVDLESDASWQASYAGALWRPAQLAERLPPAAPGNPLSGGERTVTALEGQWPALGGTLLLAVGVVLLGRFWFSGKAAKTLPRRWHWLGDPALALLAVVTLGWLVLFTHNLSLVPRTAGFDSEGHLAYITYLHQHRALPLAEDGWETHQPPLYYLLSATLLDALRLSASSFDGLAVLRVLSLLIGLCHVLLVFASLRLLFPGSAATQAVGLAVAGFLPMQLYLTHYVTNEILAACLLSATLYFALKLVRRPDESWPSCLAMGFCLGLALLTKVTALVLVPFALGALLYAWLCPLRGAADTAAGQGSQSAASPAQSGQARLRWTGPVLAVLLSVAVCGWHYWRVWRHYGHAFFVPTQWAYGVTWWQDPGYHTAAYFTRFGRCLAAPFFSGLSSLADGLYSTLWGDGLCGGAAGVLYRPPWNYQLMACAVVLALLPMLLIVLGLGASLLRLRRRPTAAWFGLLGFAGAMFFAIIHLNLEVPAYAEAKAIFGLGALIPLCALAALGWEVLSAWLGRARPAVGTLLCLWALTSYASFWVHADSAATRTALGRGLLKEGNLAGALTQFETGLQADSGYIPARSSLVAVLLKQDRLAEAAQAAERGVVLHPEDALCQLDLAAVREKQGRLDEALDHTRLAVQQAPDHPDARLRLASRLFQLHRLAETITACRQALRLTPADPDVHFLLASALAAQALRPDASLAFSGDELLPCGEVDGLSPGDVLTGEAINHFRWVVKLAPDTPEALNHLAWILATWSRAELRNGRDALQFARQACVLTANQDPATLTSLAAAYAETGQFPLAAETADKAARLAQVAGKLPLQQKSLLLKGLFLAGQAFRQAAPQDR